VGVRGKLVPWGAPLTPTLIGVNITHLPVAVVLFEHLSKLSRRSAN
jgi:hypothetical protein